MNTKHIWTWAIALGAIACTLLVTCQVSHAAIGTVASVDPLLSPPVLYDSGVPVVGGGFGTPSLDSAANGGLIVNGIEVLGPGAVFTITDDAFVSSPLADDSSLIQLNVSAGPGTNGPVGPLVPFSANGRGFDLTLDPASGLLGVAGTFAGGPAPAPGIWELDPLGVFPPALYAPTTFSATTSGLTYGPAGLTATLSTDGIAGPGTAPGLPGGIYTVPAGGPEAAIALTAAPVPIGVGTTGDDHVVTLDGRTIFLSDGSHDMMDVSGGAGTVGLLIDLDLVPAVVPALSVGGVRGTVSPVNGDIFTGWGLGGPLAPPGGSNLIRVDDFGAGAIVSVIGLDNVRDVDVGPSSLAPGGPLASGFSLYVTEVEGPAGLGPGSYSNIWEFGILIPEPASMMLVLMGVAASALVRRRKQ
jgi:PEP-CTERM motif